MTTAPSKNIAVIGAGQMGRGIAHAFATSGYAVRLIDTNEAACVGAMQAIDAIMSKDVDRGRMQAAARSAGLANITTGTAMGPELAGVSLLIETATEQQEIKTDILRAAEAHLDPGCVIATNTSALSITEIAAASRDPSRVIGMHFFNPVHRMRLVEIIRGLETAPEVVKAARAHADRLGKESIVVNEAPGFSTSRMSVLLGNEAMNMLMAGVAGAEDIDKALRLGLNHPMGPLELGDLTGWDTRLSVLKHLHSTLGETYRPCPLIHKLVAAGRLGRKVGKGVYDYADGQRVPGSGPWGAAHA